MKSDVSFFKILSTIFPIAYKSAKKFFLFWLLISIMHGVSYGVNTLMFAWFFDSVGRAVTQQSGLLMPIISAVLLGASLISSRILWSVQNFMNNSFGPIADGYMNAIINKKAGNLDPITFEDPEALDNINKGMQGGRNSLHFVVTFTSLLTFYLPYFIFMGFFLFFLQPSLILALLVIFTPALLNQIIRVKIFTKLENKSAPLRRETEYYRSCITSRELYKETRLLGAFSYFKKLFSISQDKLLSESWRAERKSGLLELLMQLITLAGYFAVLLMLVRSLMNGGISVGSFAAVFTSIGTMFSMMRQVVNYHIGNMSSKVGTIRNIIRYLNLPEKSGTETEFDLDKGLTIENVSFTYPKSDKPSVKNLNMKINPKETIAIVGVNGAGKSTFMKLLKGLYTPTEGSIKFGKTETKDISASVIYSDISAVFQNYGQYKLTLCENIQLSDMESGDTDVETPAKNADVEMDSETYPEGMDTILSKEFDGVDISGGQWQRVAIARGLYRKHSLIVLDEPTSAIDPVEETRLYHKFAEISKDVISIIVTHRLGSARIADRIVVMDDGEIVEIGSHESLLDKKGKYAELWEAQAQYYI